MVIELFDLDPFDAVTPSLTWTGQGTSVVQVATRLVNEVDYDYNTVLGHPWEIMTVSATQGDAEGQASLVGTGLPDGTTASASGSQTLDTFYAIAYGVVNGIYLLSPKTGFSISLPARAEAFSSDDATQAGGSVHLTVRAILNFGQIVIPNPNVFVGGGLSNGHISDAKTLVVTGTNAGQSNAELLISATAEAVGYHIAPPVPEPATLALVAVGLATIAWRVPRRTSGDRDRRPM
jgi:hypothetical protein